MCVFFVMCRIPPISTRTYTRFPEPTLVRSTAQRNRAVPQRQAARGARTYGARQAGGGRGGLLKPRRGGSRLSRGAGRSLLPPGAAGHAPRDPVHAGDAAGEIGRAHV